MQRDRCKWLKNKGQSRVEFFIREFVGDCLEYMKIIIYICINI